MHNETNRNDAASTVIQTPLFKVVSAHIAGLEGTDKKYVVYTVQFQHHTGTNVDPNPATLERRYTDFCTLYMALKEQHANLMAQVNFPRKVLTGNFDNKLILQRSNSFEDMLRHVLSYAILRDSPAFLSFLQDIELKKAKELLFSNEYQLAIPLLVNNFRLLNKVYTDRTMSVMLALCRVLGCYACMPHTPDAEKWAELALRRYDGVSDSDLLELYIPVLTFCSKRLERNRDVIEDRLRDFKLRGLKFNDSINLLEAVDALEKRLLEVN